jgi:ABC-type glycerol-3-phosphate transport system substrate-binding protein
MLGRLITISSVLAILAATALPLTACTDREAAESSELIVWQTETDPAAKAELEKLEQAFEKAHPGIDVKIESVPWGSLSEKLATSIRSDDPPDIAHLEPFMAYGLVERGLLSPIDDVVSAIERENGPILPAVRNLQSFDGHHYGIAYAVGVTGWTFDMRKAGAPNFPYPADTSGTITEDNLFRYLAEVKARNPNARVLLPGGTPFFMEQLFGELVANAGGRLYDPGTRQFLLNTEPARKALQFFVRLNQQGLLSADWKGQQYVDQFARLAQGDGVFLTPVTYARASVAIEKTLGADGAGQATADVFRFMSPPTSRTGARPVATIDCEPFVIFERTSQQKVPGGGTKRELAAEFLRAFYSRGHYLPFVSTVPIHLTPIFERLAQDAAYLRAIKPGWLEWHRHTMAFLTDPELTRPILVPGPSSATLGQDLRNPYLLDLQAQGIISRAINKALEPDADLEAVLNEAQAGATRLVQQRVTPESKS